MMAELWDVDMPFESSWTVASDDEDGLMAKVELMGLDEVQARKKLVISGSTYSEWLECLPRQPFQFYLKVLLQYLLSEASEGDFGISSSLFSFLPRKIEKCPECFDGIKGRLLEALFKIAGRQEYFDADIDIFGSFHKRALEISSLMNNPHKSELVLSGPPTRNS